MNNPSESDSGEQADHLNRSCLKVAVLREMRITMAKSDLDWAKRRVGGDGNFFCFLMSAMEEFGGVGGREGDH